MVFYFQCVYICEVMGVDDFQCIEIDDWVLVCMIWIDIEFIIVVGFVFIFIFIFVFIFFGMVGQGGGVVYWLVVFGVVFVYFVVIGCEFFYQCYGVNLVLQFGCMFDFYFQFFY